MTRAECIAVSSDLRSPDCEVLRALLATMLRVEAAIAAPPVVAQPAATSKRRR